MLKFAHFLKEANLSGGSGDVGERHFNSYIAPWLSGGSKDKEQPPAYELGSSHRTRDMSLPAGTKFVITGHAGKVNGTHHVNIKTEHGEETTIPVTRIKKPQVGRAGKSQEEVENYQINTVHEGITKHLEKTGQKEVNMKLPDGTIIKAAGARKVVPEDYKGLGYKPKADMIIYDSNNKPVHFVSLKGHSYQQFGGVSHLANHPVIKKAIDLFKKHRESSDNKTTAIHYDLDTSNPEHREIQQKSLYGKDHGGEYGLSNVHAVYQGDISVSSHDDGSLVLNASKTYSNKKNSAESDTGPGMKILARPSSDRSDAGMKKTRIMVAPSGLRPNSKNVEQND